jgi:DSF synthase
MARINAGAAAAARKQLKPIEGGAAGRARDDALPTLRRGDMPAAVPTNYAAEISARFDALNTKELTLEYDGDQRTLWVRQQHPESSSITPPLLHEITRAQKTLKRLFADEPSRAGVALKYIVWMSDKPGVFSLGGDLNLFAELVRMGDRDGLMQYAKDCIDVIHPTMLGYDLPVINIALVQGDALGGGFESVMPYDVVIAERGTKFGLPEIIFGLFPGMGAYSFLSRRIGVVEAERMIRSARIYSAEELHEIGLVDVLADDGFGVERAIDYVSENVRRHNVDRALYRTRRRVNAVPYQELLDIAEIWVETAMELEESDIRKMLRLAEAQERRRVSGVKD